MRKLIPIIPVAFLATITACNEAPAPGPEAGGELYDLWLNHFSALDQLDASGQHSQAAKEAERELTRVIRQARGAVLEVLRSLE